MGVVEAEEASVVAEEVEVEEVAEIVKGLVSQKVPNIQISRLAISSGATCISAGVKEVISVRIHQTVRGKILRHPDLENEGPTSPTK